MTSTPITVLIAEDDPVFRRVMSFSIARNGFTVESVGDGQAAYQRLCQGGVHFLVTDHQMPVCSGVQLLQRLAENPASKTIWPPTILCTAKGLELDSQGLLNRFNLVAIMHKPFSPRKLSELIEKHVSIDPSAAPKQEGCVPDASSSIVPPGSDLSSGAASHG